MFIGETLKVHVDAKVPTQTICTRCGYISSQEICKACVLLEGLNRGLPKLGIGKSSKAKRMLEEHKNKKCNSTECCNSKFCCKSNDSGQNKVSDEALKNVQKAVKELSL